MNSARIVPAALVSLSLYAGAIAQSTVRISLDPLGQQLALGCRGPAALSADGGVAAFVAYDPVLGNGVHVRTLATGAYMLASTTTAGVPANGLCFEPQFAAGRRFVAFASTSTNLAASDANGVGTDVFVKDLLTGTLEHVSRNSLGAGANQFAGYHAISDDGRYITFHSDATNLVPNDTNGVRDAFLFDRTTQQLECLSTDLSGVPMGYSDVAVAVPVSGDGRFVVLKMPGAAVGLPSTSTQAMVLLDRVANTRTPINLQGGVLRSARWPAISADGSTIAFSTVHAFVAADNDTLNDVYTFATATGAFALVTPGTPQGDPSVAVQSVSRSGRFVAFMSSEGFDPVGPITVGIGANLYVADTASGAIDRITEALQGAEPDGNSGAATVSDNGRFVLFVSDAGNLVAGDTNGEYDAFLRDRAAPAAVQFYGTGLAGTGGAVPPFGLLGTPAIGTVPAFALGNTTGAAPVAVFVLGLQQIAVPTPVGGVLLASPDLVQALALPVTGLVLPVPVPNVIDLVGLQLFAQSLVFDAGAPAGIAFTRGMQLTIGG